MQFLDGHAPPHDLTYDDVFLVPTRSDVGVVPAETRSDSCSWDYGGPNGGAYEGLGFDQRTLNVLLFVPAGLFLVLTVARWWVGVVLAPIGLALLAVVSALGGCARSPPAAKNPPAGSTPDG